MIRVEENFAFIDSINFEHFSASIYLVWELRTVYLHERVNQGSKLKMFSPWGLPRLTCKNNPTCEMSGSANHSLTVWRFWLEKVGAAVGKGFFCAGHGGACCFSCRAGLRGKSHGPHARISVSVSDSIVIWIIESIESWSQSVRLNLSFEVQCRVALRHCQLSLCSFHLLLTEFDVRNLRGYRDVEVVTAVM